MNELRVDPTEHNVMLTEAPHNPKANREKMCEVMFETHNVNGFYIAIQAVLSLYANGRTTGLVVDSGDGVTHTVPVYEGFQIPHAVQKNLIAGRVITKHLGELLQREHGIMDIGFQNVRKIKEQCAFVSLDYDKDMELSKNTNQLEMDYEMPDGQVFKINAPRFEAAEGLFRPDIIKQGDETPGMHRMAYNSIQECDIDVRRDLFQNVIVSGGSTMYKNLAERLEQELDSLAPAPGIVKVIAPEDRYYSVWKGGSILSGLATFDSSWVTSDDYKEFGAEIVHRKCLWAYNIPNNS